jgi:hypothetical protein
MVCVKNNKVYNKNSDSIIFLYFGHGISFVTVDYSRELITGRSNLLQDIIPPHFQVFGEILHYMK